MTTGRKIHLTLVVLLFAATVPLGIEAWTCGFCSYSRHVAPFIILGILLTNGFLLVDKTLRS